MRTKFSVSFGGDEILNKYKKSKSREIKEIEEIRGIGIEGFHISYLQQRRRALPSGVQEPEPPTRHHLPCPEGKDIKKLNRVGAKIAFSSVYIVHDYMIMTYGRYCFLSYFLPSLFSGLLFPYCA